MERQRGLRDLQLSTYLSEMFILSAGGTRFTFFYASPRTVAQGTDFYIKNTRLQLKAEVKVHNLLL